jgi:hypothetical protein
MIRARPSVRSLSRDSKGVAMLEFAFMMPIFVILCVGGSELANYITTRMRLSQIALQVADNAARIGTGTPLAAKTISETDINDVFAGAQLESGKLDLRANGRIILSDLENNPSTTGAANAYKIGWQRCYGTKTSATSRYGRTGDIKAYMGPASRQTKVLPDNASMFVEIYYIYKPLMPGISARFIPSATAGQGVVLRETASMAVRDRRNLTTGPLPVAGTTAATC